MKYNENFAKKFISSFMGKKEEKEEVNVNIPHVRELLKKLVDISDQTWGLYAFRRDPLNGKFNVDEKRKYIEEANFCGKEYARKVRDENKDLNVYEIAQKLGIEVEYPQRPVGGGHIIFAQFVEPNKVTVFKDSVDKAIDMIDKEELYDLFSNVNVEEILLAHEIFHFLEEQYAKEIYTRTEKIRLWKFGPLKNDSAIIALGEIAGMAFAKELLQLKYSPYILDVFLVYLYYPEVSYGLYKEIMDIRNK